MTRNLTQVAGSFIGTMEEFYTSEKKSLVSQIIHITDSQTAKILDTIPLGDFWDDNHHKSLKDTLEYFEFRTFGDKRYSQYLEKMNRIIIPDEDGTFIEFVIFHAIKYRLQNAVVVDVYAPASYLLLKKAKVIKPQRVSEYTASQHLGFALNGTEWRPGIVESDKYRTLDIENHTNPYAYIRRIANEFELEPRFRVETDGNKVIGRYVDLLERVGEWQGREVEFGRDLLGIERKVDDSNVVTALIGLGPERDDGTRLEVFVEDEEALQRWGIPNPQTGELMHLIETYEPESTDQDMTVERLTELTRNELEKRINSVVEYTADVADLEKVPGLENKVIRFGDTIKIKDAGFNPPLYLEARVHTQDRSLSQPEKKKVTLGDYIEYTEEEVHAIWKQLQAEIAKKVSMAEVTEVVYTKPEVDERDDAVREHADNVAENAKIEAIQVAAEDATQKARQAEDNAKEYTDGRLENTVAKDIFENTVTDLLNNIAQKVDNTRFEQVESELRGIAEGLQHEVAEHADTLEEYGGKITKLETDVDEVEGKISTTIAELQSLEETVSRHETQIEANAREIALKADKQELDLLSGTVSDISSELSVMAGQIEAKAERSEVEKLESDVSKVSQDVSKLTVDVDGIKTNVSSISQTVSNHGTQISNINSTLTQHANMIASKVEKSEFDSVTNSLGNRISTIEQTADSISLEVRDIKANVYTKSEVDSAIDGIQVGGRNLLPTVFDLYNLDGLYGYIKISDSQTMVKIYDKDVNVDISGVYFGMTGTGIDASGGYKWIVNNGTINDNYYLGVNNNYPYFSFYPKTKETFDKIFRRFYIKIEKGNKSTDWTPAPEDVDEKFTDIEGTLTSHNTKIEQNAQQIQLRATKAEVDTLSGRVNQAESQITQLAGQIELRATKTEVDELTGRVSTVESTIQQHADMIESKIDDGQARSIFRQEASSFTFDADQINFKGHVFGEDATFKGRLEGASGTFGEVTVKYGDLKLQDEVSGLTYNAIMLPNLVRDHSFEMLTAEPTGFDSQFRWADVSNKYMPIDAISRWYTGGKPKITFQMGPDPHTLLPIFGEQAVCVSAGNYFWQSVAVAQNTVYTLSAHVKRQANVSPGGTLRLEVWEVDVLGNRVRRIADKTFPPVKSDYTVERHAVSFVSPNNPESTVEIVINGGNSNWVQVDGVQLVQGHMPAIYDPEDNIWEIATGTQKVLFRGSILWQGASYLNAATTIYPSKKILDCTQGWILVWSDYDPGVGANNWDFVFTYIPKEFVPLHAGQATMHSVPINTAGETVSKILYVYNDRIQGHANNDSNDSIKDVCLRYVIEF